MNINDKDLLLHINNLSFKAFLEDSEVTYETKDQPLPFAPTSFTNDSMALRVNEKAKFSFNVYSDTRDECVTNYNNLNSLLYTIKPKYRYINDQLVPNSENVTGFVKLRFKGMPLVERNSITLHLTNFSYTINKDLGYLQVPRQEISTGKKQYYVPNDMQLIPIAYKISLEGKILLEFNQTARVTGKKSSNPVFDMERQQKDDAATTPKRELSATEKKINEITRIRKDLANELESAGLVTKNTDGSVSIKENRTNSEEKIFQSRIDLINLYNKQLSDEQKKLAEEQKKQ